MYLKRLSESNTACACVYRTLKTVAQDIVFPYEIMNGRIVEKTTEIATYSTY